MVWRNRLTVTGVSALPTSLSGTAAKLPAIGRLHRELQPKVGVGRDETYGFSRAAANLATDGDALVSLARYRYERELHFPWV